MWKNLSIYSLFIVVFIILMVVVFRTSGELRDVGIIAILGGLFCGFVPLRQFFGKLEGAFLLTAGIATSLAGFFYLFLIS